MVGWHHQLNGCESEQAPGDSEGKGGLECCSPWGHKEQHDWGTEQHKLIFIKELTSSLFFFFQCSNGRWQFDLWFLCVFEIQLEHLEFHRTHTIEAWLGEFWALLWVQLCGSLNILWHCLSLGLEWKLTFSSPVATAEFSKFAGILSTLFHSIIF